MALSIRNFNIDMYGQAFELSNFCPYFELYELVRVSALKWPRCSMQNLMLLKKILISQIPDPKIKMNQYPHSWSHYSGKNIVLDSYLVLKLIPTWINAKISNLLNKLKFISIYIELVVDNLHGNIFLWLLKEFNF